MATWSRDLIQAYIELDAIYHQEQLSAQDDIEVTASCNPAGPSGQSVPEEPHQ